MKKLILAICVGAIGLVGCASEEPASAAAEPSAKTKPGDEKASASNQQLTINPDYKGN